MFLLDALEFAFTRFGIDPSKGFVLADEMGLGKTITVLTMIRRLYDTRKLLSVGERMNLTVASKKRVLWGPTLFVVPVSVIPHWEKEAKLCWDPKDVYVFHGTKRNKKFEDHLKVMEEEWNRNSQMEIISTIGNIIKVMASLHSAKDEKGRPVHPLGKIPEKVLSKINGYIVGLKDSWVPQRPKYLGPKLIITTPGVMIQSKGSSLLKKHCPYFEGVVLDEAHIIRNASLVGNEATTEKTESDKQGSKISQNIFELVPRSKFRVAITGTPLGKKT